MTELRPYQRTALDETLAELGHADRVSVIMACGTGKTITSLRTLEALSPDLAVAAFPSIGLLAQTLRAWRADAAVGFEALAVCSDAEAGMPDEAGVDEAQGIVETTTDEQAIAEFASEAGPRIIFTTYQSSPHVGRALIAAERRADVLIADEAHRTATPKPGTFSTVVDDRLFPVDKRIFYTATPKVVTSATESHEESTALSMDDETVYGRHIEAMKFARAVSEGWLSDYQIALVSVTQPEIMRAMKGTKKTDPTLPARIAALKAAREYGLHRGLVFLSSVKKSRAFAADLARTNDETGILDARGLSIHHADASTPVETRHARLNELRDTDEGHTFLSNVRIFSEGIDSPTLDTVVFAEPRSSAIEVTQIVGRAMRRNPKREDKSIIVLPVVVSEGADAQEAIERSDFKHIWQTMRALADMDETFMSRATESALSDDDTQVVDADGRGNPILTLGFDLRSVEQAVTMRLLSPGGGVSFGLAIARLRQHYDKTGDINLPIRATLDLPGDPNWKVGHWLRTRRKDRKNEKLAQWIIDELEGMGVVWNVRDAKNKSAIARLRRHHEETGDINLPASAILDLPGDPEWKAGEWLMHRRNDYRNGTLDQWIIDELDSMGVVWSNPSARNRVDTAQRQKSFIERLRRHHDETGDINLPRGAVLDLPGNPEWQAGGQLSNWRAEYRRGDLAQWIVEELESMGFVWNPYDAKNKAIIACLRRHHDETGDINIPAKMTLDLPGDPKWRAGAWLVKARQEYRKGILAQWIIDELGSMGVVWNVRDAKNKSAIARLRKHYEKTGDINLPISAVLDLPGDPEWKAGEWLSHRRRAYKRGKLDQWIIDELDSMGFDWNPGRKRGD